MTRSASRAALAALVVSLFTASVHAAPKDKAARQAGDRVMNELFGAARFDDAKASLEKIIAQCKGGCSPQTLAVLHVDLGIVWMTGLQKEDRAKAEFAQARTLDPAVQLDPVWTTPEVKAAFGSASQGHAVPTEVNLDAEDEDEEQPRKKKKPRKHVEEEEEEEAPPGCSSDADCDGGKTCQAGKCQERPEPPRDPGVWLTLGFIQDFAFVSGSNACSQQSQVSGGFTCLRSSGTQYHGTPLRNAGGEASGIALASTRIAFSSQFRLFGPVSAGARMAWAIAGQGPQPDGGKKYIPLQAEVMGAYWFSGKALSPDHIGTFIEVSGGMAEIDGKASVTVHQDPNVPPPPNQLDNPEVQKLDAYQKMGSGFAGAGVGAFLPFGRGSGLMGDLRFSALFPSSGMAMSLGISGALGL